MAADDLKPIEDYPEISFIDNYTIKQLEEDMVNWFKEKKKEQTGEEVVLAKADDRRLILQAGAYYLYHVYMFVDNAGKMGLLKYSQGEYLENLGALKHIYREGAKGATATIRFSMEDPRTTTTGIPKGTRLTAGDGIFFATDEYCEIPIGETYIDVDATCSTPGSSGNDYDIGDLSTMVDPVPFIDNAANITKPENGADIEDDESLRQRIYIAPASYSTAGTEAAYVYFVRKFNQGISDVEVTSPEPCLVRVRYLLKDGEIPGPESMDELREYLEQPEIRPLTDLIEVLAPEQVEYSINVTYYINQNDRNRAETIQNNVNKAISEYIYWQKTKLGRDINPDKLINGIMEAGAKRVIIASPAFTIIPSGSVAQLTTESITYGGLEDD
jgi:phage-related baseplate assembly protein